MRNRPDSLSLCVPLSSETGEVYARCPFGIGPMGLTQVVEKRETGNLRSSVQHSETLRRVHARRTIIILSLQVRT